MECESENLDKSYADEKMENGINGTLDKENDNPNTEKKVSKDTQRRHDEPSELSFEICM